jgi:hypothetical protein
MARLHACFLARLPLSGALIQVRQGVLASHLSKKPHHHAACIALFKRSARQNMNCFNCLASFYDALLYK